MDRLKALGRWIDYQKCRHDWGRVKDGGISFTRVCRKNPKHAEILLSLGTITGPIVNRWYRWEGITPE